MSLAFSCSPGDVTYGDFRDDWSQPFRVVAATTDNTFSEETYPAQATCSSPFSGRESPTGEQKALAAAAANRNTTQIRISFISFTTKDITFSNRNKNWLLYTAPRLSTGVSQSSRAGKVQSAPRLNLSDFLHSRSDTCNISASKCSSGVHFARPSEHVIAARHALLIARNISNPQQKTRRRRVLR
jgi:hypothetical protein